MQFTEAQQKAIETKDCSLLVAAGAGSGKTRVLTERIIDRISDPSSKTEITDFLIVTFTKAAAKEMSERIRKALTERSVLFPENKKIIHNLALLPQAKISTISSFCLDLIKENHQRLGLSPKLRIAEDDEINLMIDRITDRIIEERLEDPESHEYFLTVYETLSGKKSDGPFAETIKKFYKKLTNLPSVSGYLNTVISRFKELEEADEIFDTFFGKIIKEYTVRDLETARALMVSALERSKDEPHTYGLFSKVIPDDIIALDNIYSSTHAGFDATYTALCNFAPKNKPSDRNIETKEFTDAAWTAAATARDIIKDDVRASFYPVSSETLKKCAADYRRLAEELTELIILLDTLLEAEKNEKGIVGFSDVERYALKLLYDDVENGIVSDAAKTISLGIKELYIDEYQDINPIQDLIFKAISTNDPDGNERNRFMVGDSKQSIYGFRGARPDIFNGYRKEFADVSDSGKPKKKIFMQNNFRCAESVIDFTNMLFESIMPEEYGDGDRLIFSKHEEVAMTQPVKLLFCNTLAEKLSTEQCQKIQAQVIYNEISSLINNPMHKSSDGKLYKLKDMTILTRTWSEAVLLERFFSEKNVPVICEKGESFFERDEIKLALNIIRSVDNPERNISTAGFMRSAAGGFTDDELTLIRRNEKNASLFAAVKKYPLSENADGGICAKTKRFLDMHSKLRTISRNSTAHEFVSRMYQVTDLINICTVSAFGPVQNEAAKIRKKNLYMLYDLARDFDKTAFKGLSAFTEYINTKAESPDSKKSASLSGEGIRIMTIHKSKGLEFPVCFIFGSEKDTRGNSEKIIMNENAGFAFRLKSLEKISSVQGVHGFVTTDTPLRLLIKRICDDAEALEDKRLLYVAVTRARDRLYITACPKAVKDYEKKIKENRLYKITKGKNQLELILACLYTLNKDFTVEYEGNTVFTSENGHDAFEANVNMYTSEFAEGTAAEEAPTLPCVTYEPDALLLSALKQKIEASDKARSSLNTIPPKLTVSLLKHGLIDYEDTENASEAQRNPLEMPEFIRETAEKTGAEKGTAMHTFLQFASFDSCEAEGCLKEADRLAENGFITAKQREMLDIDKLDAFFKTELYAHIKSAVKVHRELRFNLKARPEEVIANVPQSKDFVLVQGVIDCFTENADGTYTVIDFKTDNVKAENAAEILTERYKNQLAFYCMAVEDITKKKVSRAVIFSFSGMEAIELDTDTLKFG